MAASHESVCGMAAIRNDFIRSATLSGYLKAAQDVGLDPHAALKKAGLNYECLDSPDLPISLLSFIKLLQISAVASDHQDFGARAAIARGVPDLGPVSLLLREAESIEDALQILISRLHLHGDGTNMAIDVRSSEPFISFRIAAPRSVDTRQATEFCVCGITQLIRWLIGSNWRPQRVCFAHASPGQAQVQRAFFQAPVWYEQRVSGIAIDQQTLRRRVETSAPFLRRLAKQYLETSLASKPADFSTRVSQVIVQRLPRDSCTIEEVAEILGVHRRTLARRLERDGQSYSELLQKARYQIAQHAAADRHLSLTEAAEVTGFQNLSSFSRWFRVTFGRSATQWRQDSAQRSTRLLTGSRRSRVR
jgi:AraC-like DNA-binding protein